MTEQQEAIVDEHRSVTAPELTTPEATPPTEKEAADLQTDTQNFRLDEAIEGLRNSSLEMKAKTDAEQETRANREAAIWNIAVDVQVVLGTLNLTVADLLAMKPDTSFPLGMAGEAPLELVAGGHTIGWCELVAPQRRRRRAFHSHHEIERCHPAAGRPTRRENRLTLRDGEAGRSRCLERRCRSRHAGP